MYLLNYNILCALIKLNKNNNLIEYELYIP